MTTVSTPRLATALQTDSTESGRILLPLYSDTFSFSIMAITDDGGQTWQASQPIMGFGGIQPAVMRRNDGTLVAYMRENGYTGHIRVCESKDDGMSWGPVTEARWSIQVQVSMAFGWPMATGS